MDPYDLKLRINAFDKENYKLLSSSNLEGDDLKSYLKQDKKSYLMEGQNREDLGKYLVENILVDHSQNAMMLLKSQVGADDGPPKWTAFES